MSRRRQGRKGKRPVADKKGVPHAHRPAPQAPGHPRHASPAPIRRGS
ncbi:MAG TPA: hypothetical protein VMM12_11380 [Longimicrobiales bacterium]|nr:hypothetical protein [Longimicrobiales bacterium]